MKAQGFEEQFTELCQKVDQVISKYTMSVLRNLGI